MKTKSFYLPCTVYKLCITSKKLIRAFDTNVFRIISLPAVKQFASLRLLFIVAFAFYCSVTFAQYTYQNASSIIVNPNYNSNNASIEASFEFNHFQLTGMYNLSDKVFVHSNFKLNVLPQKGDKFFGGFLGGKPVMLHTHDVGGGVGFGLQNIGSIGRFKLQLVAGYDYEKQHYTFKEKRLNTYESYVDSISTQRNALYKISTNLNFIKNTEKYNWSYLLRLSYCQFTKYQYNNVDAMFKSQGFGIAEPAVQLDIKLLKNRNLYISSQFGLSIPLSNINYGYKADLPFDATTETSDYLLDVILKLGVKYNFINH